MLSQEVLSREHQGAETGSYQCTPTVEQDARHDDGQRIEKREVAVDAACEIDDGGCKAEVAENLKIGLPDIVDVEPQQREVERSDNENAQSRSEQTRSRIGVN